MDKHEWHHEIVCPYCGYEFTDSWENSPNDECFDVDCSNCGKEFHCTRYISINYSSKAQCGLGGAK